jgi:O-antigen/teichoic acid export membrane protein
MKRLSGKGVGAVLARGAGLFLVIHMLSVFVALVVQVILARTMGAEIYGTYVYAYNWLLVLLLFCRLGLGTASLRFVAAMTAREEWGLLRGYLRTSHALVLGASLVIAAASAALVMALGSRIPLALRETFLVACLALPVYALLQLSGLALRGLKRVLFSQLPSSVVQPALLGLGVLAVARAGHELLAPTAMWINLGAASVALVLCAVALWHALPAPVRSAPARTEVRAWLAVAMPLLVFNTLNVVIHRTDILLVGALLGAKEAGVYAVASRVATMIAFGLLAMNSWAAPLISELYARGDQAGLQRLARRAAQGIFVFTFPLALAVVFFGKQILQLFGSEFPEGHLSLAILAGGHLVNALVGPVGFLMTMTGAQKAASWILAVHAVLNIALNATLIPLFGIEGAAFATALTNASWNMVMAVAVWHRLRVRATIL